MKFFSLTGLVLVISTFLIALSATAVALPEPLSGMASLEKRQDALCPINGDREYLTVPGTKCKKYYGCGGDNGKTVQYHDCPEYHQFSERLQECIVSLFKLCVD
ncbi:hypothetical protein BJV82DRAFT_600845 [Fennellomyces sp. T-0311]|nr:hypothetical protein BJV82DRAFT_600845 [Fennellomyces sp. T-0311]